jgi:hypothetical protein
VRKYVLGCVRLNKWKIANIDDLTEEEKTQLMDFEFFNVFDGLFIISSEDVEIWKTKYNFDDWIIEEFPQGYVDNGRIHECLDHCEKEITDLMYYINEKLLYKYYDILNGVHPSKNLHNIEEHFSRIFSKWDRKELVKYHNNRLEFLTWYSKELCKASK